MTDNGLREYHTWRAKTTTLLLPKIKSRSVEDRIGGLWRKLSDTLRQFVTEPDSKFDIRLREILVQAVNLDQCMNTQKAVFTPRSCFQKDMRFGFPFDRQSMESIDTDGDAYDHMDVELVVAPALLKAGNSKGEDYGTESVLVHSQVSCQRILRSQEQDISFADSTAEQDPGSYRPKGSSGRTSSRVTNKISKGSRH